MQLLEHVLETLQSNGHTFLDTESSIVHLCVERKKNKFVCGRGSSVHRLTNDFEHAIAMFKSCFRLVILLGLSPTCTKVVPLVLSFRMMYKRGPSVA